MGGMQSFFCDGCDYGAMVAGGYSLNMSAQIHTVSCSSCKELSDVITRSFELGNFPPPRDPDSDVPPEVPLRCPQDASHAVEPWESGGPCPRCGEAMKAGGDIILTD